MPGVTVLAGQAVSFKVAFHGLQSSERSVLNLIYGAKLTQSQIATRLSMSEAAVRQIAARALVTIGNQMCGIASRPIGDG